jgi:hypothetical protein
MQYYLRFARLLKQQSLIGAYRLPKKENKPLIYVSSKLLEVCRFRFLFAANNGRCHFLLVPFSVCGILETWRTETGRHQTENGGPDYVP